MKHKHKQIIRKYGVNMVNSPISDNPSFIFQLPGRSDDGEYFTTWVDWSPSPNFSNPVCNIYRYFENKDVFEKVSTKEIKTTKSYWNGIYNFMYHWLILYISEFGEGNKS